MAAKEFKTFPIYPGVELQGDLEEIRTWCTENGVTFSALFRERIRELARIYRKDPKKLREIALRKQ